jgi:hypothetical protein
MLAVVQDQQHLLRSEVVREDIGKHAAWLLAYIQSGGNGLGHESRFGQRRQIYHPRAVLELLDHPARHRQSEPRLATTTGTG